VSGVQVRTFEAVDMKQALKLVRREMGPRAVIVSSRSVRKDGGLFGLLGRRVLEVTAATEDEPDPRKAASAGADVSGASASEDAHGFADALHGAGAYGATDGSPIAAGPSDGRARGAPAAGLPRAPITPGRKRPGNIYHELRAVKQAVDPVLDEVRSLRESVGALHPTQIQMTEDLRADVAQIRTLLSSMIATGALAPSTDGAAAQKLYYFLLARGIDDPLARALIQRVVARVDAGALGDLERLKLNLAAEMRHDLARAARGTAPGRVQMFVGPTGVGKTTTIAKLASRAAGASPEGVLLLTTDVHRVAAVEQMVRFGEMLDIPVEVAVSPEDLSRVLARTERRVFIDTAGRSHRDAAVVRSLEALIAAAGDVEVMLVLSATTRAADSREILHTYLQLPCSRLIMTKLDETRVYGELFNCVVRSNRPIACVTTGQSVPQHIESLDAPGILKKVLHG
jgi:flagellar biosynthesis protein FlhF